MAILSDRSLSLQCSLCDDRLLRHLRKSGICWFCPSCRQDMPVSPQSISPQPILQREQPTAKMPAPSSMHDRQYALANSFVETAGPQQPIAVKKEAVALHPTGSNN